MTDNRVAPAPRSEIELTKRIKALAREFNTTERHLRSATGNVVVSQLLPHGVVRGGTAMYLRRGLLGSHFKGMVWIQRSTRADPRRE